MRASLAAREAIFGALFPWDHANYGMDESWVRCDPYEQHVAPCAAARLDAVITHHSAVERPAACRPALPSAWGGPAPLTEGCVPARSEGRLAITIAVPPDAAPGRYIIPVDVAYAGRVLPQFAEAIIVVQ